VELPGAERSATQRKFNPGIYNRPPNLFDLVSRLEILVVYGLIVTPDSIRGLPYLTA